MSPFREKEGEQIHMNEIAGEMNLQGSTITADGRTSQEHTFID